MNETARIEAFSDGVFSIAATLLVLNLKYPPSGQPFWTGMLGLWPGYLSFVLSFLFIGVMWISHHRLFTHIQKADDLLMAVNLLVLLGVVLVPYPTQLLATSIATPDTARARDVAIFYNAVYLGVATLFNLLWFVCIQRKVLDHYLGVQYVREATKQHAFGLLCYAACLAMTWWSVPISLAMNSILAIWFLLPPRYRVRIAQKHREPTLE